MRELILSFFCFIFIFLLNILNGQNITPTSISNLELWLKADAGVSTIGGLVDSWQDQSGAENHVAQTNNNNRPLLVNVNESINNLPSIRFDGVNDFLLGPTISNLGTSNFSFFIICKGYNQSASNIGVFSIGPTSSGIWLNRRASVNRISFTQKNTQLQGSTIFDASGFDFRQISLVKQVGVSMASKINGVQEAFSTAANLISDFTNTNFYVGSGTAANFFSGDIVEILLFKRNLSTSEQTQVEKYLMDKYAPPVNLGADINNSYGFCDLTLAPVTGFYTNYLWSNNATTSSISINNPGTYWVDATDIFGRVSRDTIVVSRPHYASISLSDQLVCYNDLPTVTAAIPSGDYTFVQWSDGNPNQTRQYTQGGTLSYTIRDNQNCTRTSNTATITFDNSLQNVRLGNDTTLCVGNSIGLAVTSPSINSYIWSTTETGTTTTVTAQGNYSVTVTNSNNCQKSDTIFVTIAGESPTVQVLIPNSVCVGSTLSYDHISSVNGGSIADVLWDFGDNTTSISDSGTKVYAQVGTYNGTLLATTDGGCQTQVPFQVVVRNLPLVSFTYPTFCTGQPVNFTNTSSVQNEGGSLQNFVWQVDNQQIASTQNTTYTFPINGSYGVKLIVTDVNGCVDSTSQIISASDDFPVPQAPVLTTPVPNITLAVGQAQTFQWSNVPNTTAYIFEVSTQSNFSSLHFQSSTSSTSISYVPTTTGNLFWRVRSVNLCQLGGTSEIRTYSSVDLGTGISLWLRADAGVTTVSNAVSQWSDQSGMGLNVSQATAGNRPTLVNNVTSLNNRPAISFNGTSNFLTSSMNSGLANSSMTVFVIGSGGSQSTANAVYYSIGPVSSGFWLTRRASNSRIGAYNNNQLVQGTLTNLPTSGYDFRLFGVRKSLGNALQIKVNGINEIVSTNTTAIGSFTDANIQIGAGNSGSFLNGQIAEVLVYNRDLSDLELNQVEKYLMDKYAPPVNLGADINNSYGFCDLTLAPVTGFYTNYLWSNNATTSSISINNPGTYWVRATDIFGRVSSDTIIVNRPHFSQIALNNRLVCFNEPQVYSANVPANYQFITWNDGIQTPSRIVAEPLSLTYTVMDTNSCLRTSNVGVISIDSTLKYISLGLDTALCVGNTIALTQSAPEITSYLWSTNSTISTATAQTTGEYWVEVGNANNCKNRDTIFVQILGVAPSITLDIPNQACQFDSVLLSQTSSVNGTGIINAFEWKIDGNLASNLSNTNTVFVAPNNYQISFTASTNEGCQTQVSQSIIVHPKPIASFQISNQCPYEVMNFNPQNNIPVPLDNYLWNFGQSTAPINSSNLVNPTHFYGIANTYNVTLQVQDVNGCRDTVVQAVEVFPAPNTEFNFENGCQRDGVAFTNNSSITAPYFITSQNWQFGDDTQTNNVSPLKTYLEFGPYDVRLVNIASNGCVDTLIKTITIHPKPDLAWTVSPSCNGLLTRFSSQSEIQLGTIIETNWLVNLQYPQQGTAGNYRFVTNGLQYLTLTCVSNEGCVEDTLIAIQTLPELSANYSIFPLAVVAGKETRFTNQSIGANSVFFDFGDGSSQQFNTSPNIFNHIYSDTLIDEVITTWMYVENNGGCRDSISRTFTVNRPDLDLALSNIFLQEQNGFFKIGVELRNQGKVNINQVELVVSKSGVASLKENYTGLIQPGQVVVHLLNGEISSYYSSQDEQTDFLCVEAKILTPNEVETLTDNNLQCEILEDGMVITPLSPNPTNDVVYWSTFTEKNEGDLLVELVAMNGAILQSQKITLQESVFETHQMNVSKFASGTYLIRMTTANTVKTFRLIKR
jgi:PKD repeat protein